MEKSDWSYYPTKIIYAAILFIVIWAFLIALNRQSGAPLAAPTDAPSWILQTTYTDTTNVYGIGSTQSKNVPSLTEKESAQFYGKLKILIQAFRQACPNTAIPSEFKFKEDNRYYEKAKEVEDYQLAVNKVFSKSYTYYSRMALSNQDFVFLSNSISCPETSLQPLQNQNLQTPVQAEAGGSSTQSSPETPPEVSQSTSTASKLSTAMAANTAFEQLCVLTLSEGKNVQRACCDNERFQSSPYCKQIIAAEKKQAEQQKLREAQVTAFRNLFGDKTSDVSSPSGSIVFKQPANIAVLEGALDQKLKLQMREVNYYDNVQGRFTKGSSIVYLDFGSFLTREIVTVRNYYFPRDYSETISLIRPSCWGSRAKCSNKVSEIKLSSTRSKELGVNSARLTLDLDNIVGPDNKLNPEGIMKITQFGSEPSLWGYNFLYERLRTGLPKGQTPESIGLPNLVDIAVVLETYQKIQRDVNYKFSPKERSEFDQAWNNILRTRGKIK